MKKINLEINVPDGLAQKIEEDAMFRQVLEFALEGQLLVWNLEKLPLDEVVARVGRRVRELSVEEKGTVH